MNEEIKILSGHEMAISDVKFSKDGEYLATAGKDGCVIVRTIACKLLSIKDARAGAVRTISWSDDNRKIFSGHSENIVVLDMEKHSRKIAASLRDAANSIDCRKNTFLVATGSRLSNLPEIAVYENNRKVFCHELEHTIPSGALFSGSDVVFSDDSGSVSTLDMRNNKVVATKRVHEARITHMARSPCETYFATASEDKSVKVLAPEDWTVMRTFDMLSSGFPHSVALSRCNRLIIYAGGIRAEDVSSTASSRNFELFVGDLAREVVIGNYLVHFGTINTIAMHPHDIFMATGSEDGNAYLIPCSPGIFKPFLDAV